MLLKKNFIIPFLVTLAALMSHQVFAKDVGVCVQIIEHLESQEISKDKESNTDASNTNASNTDSSNTNVSNDKKEKQTKTDSSKKNSNQKSEKNAETATEKPKVRAMVGASTELDTNSLGDSPIPPAAAVPGDTDASESSQVTDYETPDEKNLAAARSDFEMAKPANLWDHELDILPYGQTALVYLKRLFEHFVTHEPGFASTSEKCEQTITVELYPLKRGWTAFARYSGTNREERVDQLLATELSQFAERAVLALLTDVPISATIKRDNVLSSDSKRQVQQVKGSNHFTLNIGTRLVFAKVNQVQVGGENDGDVDKELRLYHPWKFGVGYRGRFENWGIEVQGGLGIGVGKKAASSNPSGGHIDYGGDTGLAIHFLNYRDPRGLVSFYLGGGAGFDFTWFSVVNGEDSYDKRSYLYSGGLTADGVFGWEFLRAASVQFFIQGEINLPLYVTRTENNYGEIASWMPGLGFKLGVVF